MTLPEYFSKIKKETDNENTDAIISNQDALVFELLNEKLSKSDFCEIAVKIAYANYAIHKHQYIQFFYKKHNRLPSNQELNILILSFKNENSSFFIEMTEKVEKDLIFYIEEKAKKMLDADYRPAIASVLEKEIYSLKAEMNTTIAENANSLKTTIKDSTQLKTSILASLVASFFYTIIIGLIVASVTASESNNKFFKIFRILFDLDKTPVEEITK